MTPDQAFDVARMGLMTLLFVSGPIMIIALAVGLIIALFQALTSIQEMTLTFVPKMLVVFASFFLLIPFMGNQLFTFAEHIFNTIAGGQ